MKTKPLVISAVVLLIVVFLKALHSRAQAPKEPGLSITFEYASVRFMEEKTSIVWPDGSLQNVMELSGKKKYPNGEYYPKGSDYRMYWLTMAINIMGKRGFEFAFMNNDDVIMKRSVGR